MARRVNTKFVVILSAAVVGTVGIFGGVRFYSWSQAHNPTVVLAKGESAEKAGDLKTAVMNFSNAAQLMSVKHLSGADDVFARSADLCMKISREAQSQEDAVRYYQMALDNYSRALTENPLNKAVNQTLMEEDYQNAQVFPSNGGWKTLEEVTGKLIKSHDGAKARLYRAEARLNLLEATLQSSAPAPFAPLEEDLAAAQKFEPHSGQAVALRAQVMCLQAACRHRAGAWPNPRNSIPTRATWATSPPSGACWSAVCRENGAVSSPLRDGPGCPTSP